MQTNVQDWVGKHIKTQVVVMFVLLNYLSYVVNQFVMLYSLFYSQSYKEICCHSNVPFCSD